MVVVNGCSSLTDITVNINCVIANKLTCNCRLQQISAVLQCSEHNSDNFECAHKLEVDLHMQRNTSVIENDKQLTVMAKMLKSIN